MEVEKVARWKQREAEGGGRGDICKRWEQAIKPYKSPIPGVTSPNPSIPELCRTASYIPASFYRAPLTIENKRELFWWITAGLLY